MKVHGYVFVILDKSSSPRQQTKNKYFRYTRKLRGARTCFECLRQRDGGSSTGKYYAGNTTAFGADSKREPQATAGGAEPSSSSCNNGSKVCCCETQRYYVDYAVGQTCHLSEHDVLAVQPGGHHGAQEELHDEGRRGKVAAVGGGGVGWSRLRKTRLCVWSGSGFRTSNTAVVLTRRKCWAT